MYEALKNRALALLKVPSEPHAPLGDPASLRVFRAGRNYYRLRIAVLLVTQVLPLAAIVFWTGMLIEVERLAEAEHAQTRPVPAATITSSARDGDTILTPSGAATRQQRFDRWRDDFVTHVTSAANNQSGSRSPFERGWAAWKRAMVEVALLMPSWVFPLVWALKVFGFVLYFAQLGVNYAATRLDYEMRWYLVTDRSLRLRHGVWVVWESTMSFANVQQVVVSQGPLQRLLGLANVKVQSAGGGTDKHEHTHDDMHVGYFHSVTNAEEIRDLILQRLRRFRESGLGDPDEKPAPMAPPAGVSPVVAAARELVTEARALRSVIRDR